MSALALWIARQVWWGMLWLMRRPWMRRLQERFIRRGNPEKQAKLRAGVYRQNRLARKYGLKILHISIQLLLASIIITLLVLLILYLSASGVLDPPKIESVENS